MLITDMNERERNSFANKADTLAEVITKLATALRGGDDAEILTYLVLASLSGVFMNELNEIYINAKRVNMPDDASRLTTPSNNREDKQR
jgi:HD-like signal output (HDOD) protein